VTQLSVLLSLPASITSAGNVSSGETALFWVVAPLMVFGALGLLFARKAVHAALGIVLVMISLAFLYTAQEAPFLGVVQVVVYTGAVMMLFVFVLMLVGVDNSDSLVETLKGQRWIGAILGLGIAAALIGVIRTATFDQARGLTEPNADSNPVGVARVIFGQDIFAFEVVGVLLITAALGALVLTHRQRLVPRVGQKERADARVASGGRLAPLAAPGVYAGSNALDTPALDPEGRPIEASVSRVLRIRGQRRSVGEVAARIGDTSAIEPAQIEPAQIEPAQIEEGTQP
jgi:NADH-quinone oxidoreductase subunit J